MKSDHSSYYTVVLSVLHILTQYSQQTYAIHTIIIPILHIRKLKSKDVKKFP